MPVWAVSMVRDEADVIAGTLEHMAGEGVAGIIVADNGSTDGTREILDGLELDCPLIVVDDREPAYYQSKKMTVLAEEAADLGATWIVPFDADELWYWNGDRLAVELQTCMADVVFFTMLNHIPTGVDPEGHPFEAIQWRLPQDNALPKVAFRWRPGAVIEQGNHGVELPGEAQFLHGGMIRHFPWRSAEQFTRKALNGAKAYRASDLPPEFGAHWRQYGDLADRYGDQVLGEVFRQHFWHLAPVEAGLVHDPAPYLRWR